MITAAQQHAQRNRGTLFVESGELLSVASYPGDQHIMRIRAPNSAAHARPGSFVHVSCNTTLPMRRPLSIMRADDDWIEILYKVVGNGLHALADRRPGDLIDVLGPIGTPFMPLPDRPHCLLLGGGVGIPPMIFLADTLRTNRDWQPVALLGSEIPFPFPLQASAIAAPWAGDAVNCAMPLLEEWGVPSRLASMAGFDGCFRGYVTDLAEQYLRGLDAGELAKTQLFACGPTPMLQAVAAVAARYALPCQVSLEEFMACAVGGCAGCTVEIRTPDGPAMKRVCVDGPVFDAASVVWQ